MKISKKIGVGILLLLVALSGAIVFTGEAFADVVPADISKGKYLFQDGGNIIGDFGSSGKVTFVDVDSLDTIYNYKPIDTNGFCDPGDVPDKNGVDGKIKYGINPDGSALKASNVPAQVKLSVYVGGNCSKDPKIVFLGKVSISNPGSVAAADFQWDGDNITSLGGADDELTFSPAPNAPRLYLSPSDNQCGYDGAILLDKEKGNTGNYYELVEIKQPFKQEGISYLKDYPALRDYANLDESKCGVKRAITITVAGEAGKAAPDSAISGNTGANGSSCEASVAGFSLSWIMCPLFNSATALTNSLLGIFQKQLSFTVSQNLGNSDSQTSVRTTWGILKNIATVVLVIIMLVMLISQAVGGGPFDAYTVRKLLPKLVAAAILMQISWPLTAWVIDVFNDFGKGLQDLMYAGFGGSSTLNDLGKLLMRAGISQGDAVALNYVGIALAAGLALAALPTALFLAFAAAVALLTAVVVLIFRKILIILLLLSAPIALAAWILPGTQRYWKLWSENLLKVLVMFPLVVAIISVGRIFAYIAGGQDNSEFLNLLFVLVGFFGPLFLLPKTFRWGGGIMSAAGSAITSAGGRLQKAGEEPIKGYGQRWQGERAKQYRPQASVWSRGLRRIQSGHALPTERSRRLTIAAGDKWAAERNDEAAALVQRTYETSLSKGHQRRMTDEDGNYISGIQKNAQGQMLDAHGNVTEFKREAAVAYRGSDKNQAEIESLKGVEAGKQALVDITGYEGSDTAARAAQAAHKQLLDTHSEIELQNARIQGGRHEGKRATEVQSWKTTLENSPPHYSAITSSRPDQAPDVIEGAESDVGMTYEQAYEFDNTTVNPATGLTARQSTLRLLDHARLETTLNRLTPENLASSHYGLFQDIARLNDPALSTKLRETLVKFRDKGGQPGNVAVGSLRGGKEKFVNQALRAAGADLDHL